MARAGMIRMLRDALDRSLPRPIFWWDAFGQRLHGFFRH